MEGNLHTCRKLNWCYQSIYFIILRKEKNSQYRQIDFSVLHCSHYFLRTTVLYSLHAEVSIKQTTEAIMLKLTAAGRASLLGNNRIDDGHFLRLARNIVFRRTERREYSPNVMLRRFREHFGCDPAVASYLWNRIKGKNKEKLKQSRPEHLLWALLFMKLYLSESSLCSMCGCKDEKTFRKWSKIFVEEVNEFAPEEVSSSWVLPSLYSMFHWMNLLYNIFLL